MPDQTPTQPVPDGDAGRENQQAADDLNTDRYEAEPTPVNVPAPEGVRATPESVAATHTPWYRRRSTALIAGVSAAALVLGGGSVAAGVAVTSTVARSVFGDADDHYSSDRTYTDRGNSNGRDDDDRGNFDDDTDQSDSGSTSSTATPSTAEQQIGVVTISTTIGYSDSAEAEGTGMVLTSGGLILTNNHVIDGSTSIEVTIESTGETYSATVVGSDSTEDVAVLQVEGAPALTEVEFDSTRTVAVGDEVYSVGNAEGTGELVTASGTVTDLDETITVENESTGAGDTLQNLIELDANVVSGDSGGPLFDSDGQVIGVITAASSGSSEIVGYAIDIDTALAVAQQIASGTESGTVQIGATPFLGIQLGNSNGAAAGATVGGVVADTPAAAAGLEAGDLITAVDGTAVTTAQALSDAIAAREVGDTITLTWTDTTGASRSADIVLASGPA